MALVIAEFLIGVFGGEVVKLWRNSAPRLHLLSFHSCIKCHLDYETQSHTFYPNTPIDSVSKQISKHI